MTPIPEWTIAAASSALGSGAITAVSLTQQFLHRIEALNPTVNALRSFRADQALSDARRIDEVRASGADLPSLAGIPIVIKENCDVSDSACSAGLSFRHSHIASKDAAITTVLRQQGAIILGMSISDPGAFGTRTAEVNHPLDARLTVGGSSGGSAAALAANMCLGAIGTDTGGSIRIPSACCGTAGLKPTFGTMPMDGIFPLVPSLDHVGPMARTAEDLATLWDAIHPKAPTSSNVRAIGFDPRWIEQADRSVRDSFALALKSIEGTGVQVTECQLPDLDAVAEIHGQIFLVEAAAYHEAHCAEHLNEYPGMAQDWFKAARAMSVSSYINACKQRIIFRDQTNSLFEGVDALVLPTLAKSYPEKSAVTLPVNSQDMDFTMAMVRFTCLFNHTGHPVASIPWAGAADPLTGSLQIVGQHSAESRILKLSKLLQSQ